MGVFFQAEGFILLENIFFQQEMLTAQQAKLCAVAGRGKTASRRPGSKPIWRHYIHRAFLSDLSFWKQHGFRDSRGKAMEAKPTESQHDELTSTRGSNFMCNP